MAHGLGLTRACGLRPIAETFARNGYRVLVFDYRHFGVSDGAPRRLISNKKQMQDWAAAIAFARTLPSVDPEKIVTWGFSFGGGHAIAIAAEDQRVACAVGVSPMLSGFSSTLVAMKGWGAFNTLRIIGTGFVDVISRFFGGRTFFVPVSATPGGLGLLTSADAKPGYEQIVPRDFDYNTVARVALFFWLYRPGRQLQRLKQPVLLMPFTPDCINPAEVTRKYAKQCASARIVELDCHHMEALIEPHRSRIVEATLEFLRSEAK